MPKHGKGYNEKLTQLDKGQVHSLAEAVALVKATARAKFDETVDLAVNLGVDPRHGDQMVRGTCNVPHGTGKKIRVAVFAKGDFAEQAREAGADHVGAEDLISQIQEGWRDFDILVATPDMVPQVSRLGRLLGPRMPNAKSGTVTTNVSQVVGDLKKSKRVGFRVEKAGIVHMPIGKASFEADQLLENMVAALSALVKARPQSAKGRYLKKISLSLTMGPSVQVDVQEAQKVAESTV